MRILITLILPLCILFSACEQVATTGAPEKETVASEVDAAHPDRTALDWSGVYRGTLPCADCEGIATEIILKEGDTFMMRQRYLGKSDSVVVNAGSVTWHPSEHAITLTTGDDEQMNFAIETGALSLLDEDGEKIAGTLSENYVLRRPVEGSILYGIYWQLAELEQDAVEPDEQGRRMPHLIFKQQDYNLTGSTGCNTLNGTFSSAENGSLNIVATSTTRIACPEMLYESRFLQMLDDVSEFEVENDSLILRDESGKVRARFVADYLR
jgi:heat shock protein HslJ/uncharacterized lipoprotein NlpE involved in copper resistance